MVQITPEEVMARKKMEVEFGGLDDYDRKVAAIYREESRKPVPDYAAVQERIN